MAPCFAAISKPARKSRRTSTQTQPLKVVEVLPPDEPNLIKPLKRKPVSPPLLDSLQWDDDALGDEKGSVSQITPLSPPRSSPQSPGNAKLEADQRVDALMEEITILRQMLQQQQQSKSQATSHDLHTTKEGTDSTHFDTRKQMANYYAPPLEVPKDKKIDPAEFFVTKELEELRAQAGTNTQQTDDELADQWVRDLNGAILKPMAKSLGRVVAATNYGGEPHPTVFAAWCDSVKSIMPMYDVPPGPSQVQTATWFLTGRAKSWWTDLRANRGYGHLRTLELFFDALRLEFQPHDAAEQCMDKWCALKQTHSVTQYMNEADELHNTWRLCEKAEFGLVMRGLKRELKGVIRRAMIDSKRQWMSLKELRALAHSAEAEKNDPPGMRSSMFSHVPKVISRPWNRTPPQHQQHPYVVGAVDLRDPKSMHGGEIATPTNMAMSLPPAYRCGVCGMRNHLTTRCVHRKKEGCWRCGGKHHLRDCRAPFIRNHPKSTNKDDVARGAILGMVLCEDNCICAINPTLDLTYPVRVNASHITAIATLDTGAQCSAIRRDVAEAAGVDWTPCMGKDMLRGVSGEPLDVLGKLDSFSRQEG